MGVPMSNWKKGLILGCAILLCIGAIIVSFWLIPVVILVLWGLLVSKKKNQ
jgi:hypothetical protein